MGVVICYICADERVDELRSEGNVVLAGNLVPSLRCMGGTCVQLW